MPKTVVVVRADSDIGGAVACALSKNPNYTVKAIAVDTNDPNIQDVKQCNIPVIQHSLADDKKLKDILSGADACFIVTKSDFSNPQFVEDEIEQGQNIAEACLEAKVPHVVFSTQLHPFKITGISCRPLVAKAELEGYMRQIGLPVSFIMIPSLYEDYFGVLKPMRPLGSGNGPYDIVIPTGTTPLNMISVEDIGESVHVLLSNKEAYLNKTLSICGDKLTVREMAAYLTRHSGVPFKEKQLTTYQFAQFGQPWSQDLANMFDFILRVDQRYNLQETRRLCPKTQSFEDWVKRNAGKIRQTFT